MAKKVKKKVEEDEDYKAFSFPEFDVVGFIEHELEQTSATMLAVIMAVTVAIVSWRLSLYGFSSGLSTGLTVIDLVIGIGGAVMLPFLVLRLREKATDYRKGDWATLIAVYFFMWLGLWSLLLNL